jgi:hypothetical protein
LLGQSQDEQAKLRDAYFVSGKRDRAAIVAPTSASARLRVQRIENSLDAAEKIEAVLTPQQRESLRRFGPWWMSRASSSGAARPLRRRAPRRSVAMIGHGTRPRRARSGG